MIIIEYAHVQSGNPRALPFMLFETNKEADKFSNVDLKNVIYYLLWNRRNKLWINHHDNTGMDNLSSLKRVIKVPEQALGNNDLVDFVFEHASQPQVKFKLNIDFVPDFVGSIREKEDDKSKSS